MMNDQQRVVAQAYERLNSPDATVILDDLTVFINNMQIEHQAGALRLLAYVLLKRSAIRREKAAGPKAPAKGKI